MSPPLVTYFAYGSNLCLQRFESRVPSAAVRGPARLHRYRLRWHKRSNIDGSGKCSVLWTGAPRDVVHGVLYDFAAADKPRLDRIEGLGSGYGQARVTVAAHAGAPVDALTYVAQASYVDDSLRPFDWYRDLVVYGAQAAGLPSDYVARLARVAADPDPDGRREATNRGAIPCGPGPGAAGR